MQRPGPTHRLCPRAVLAAALLLPPPSPAAAQQRKPPAGKTAAAAVPGAAADCEARVRADIQEMVEGHIRYSGLVDLDLCTVRLQADVVDIYDRTDQAGRRIVAAGNVVFMQGEERLAGERLEMDLGTGKGVFTNARGYVQPGVLVEARRIERVDADTYRLEGARFTSCYQPNPRWAFQASSARLEVDDKIVARNALFKVKGVPALYLPLLVYPIQEDQRSTGFLMPSYTSSGLRGSGVEAGFFWAMGRSFDQTFYAERYSKFGYGLGHELRYALAAPSHGVFTTYLLRPKGAGRWDHDLDWTAVQMLPARMRATLRVNEISESGYQGAPLDNFDRLTNRVRTASVNVQRSFGGTYFSIAADSTKTTYGEELQVRERLPSVSLSRFAQQIGRSGLAWGFQAHGDVLGIGDAEEVKRHARIDVYPELSYNIGVPFLTFSPRVLTRYTRYGAAPWAAEAGRAGVTKPIDRAFFEGGVQTQGPKLARIFDSPLPGLSDKLKHVIFPEVSFVYRDILRPTDVRELARIPFFDSDDRLFATRQVSYGLIQSLFIRRQNAAGKSVSHEFLRWTVRQTRYFDISQNQNEFDPEYETARFGAVGGVAYPYSPILSKLRLAPRPGVAANFDVQYNTQFDAIQRVTLSADVRTSALRLNASWSDNKNAQEVDGVRKLVDGGGSVNGSLRLELVPRKLSLEGDAYYDLFTDRLIHSRVSLRYQAQCCGFIVKSERFRLGQRDENRIGFSIDLANIGSVGTAGEEPGQAGLIGVRR